MLLNDPIVLTSYARTPIGAFQGCLSSLSASQLGSIAIAAVVARAKLSIELIEEVIMGCVLSAGQGQAPARQAALAAKLNIATNCTTINKMCGSGMKAVMLAHDLLLANSNEIMIAGGMESMTNAPYLLNKARSGYRMGHASIQDHMLLDGLEDAYNKGQAMGVFADITAAELGFSRKIQDDFALQSLHKANQAIKNNLFAAEITAVTITDKNGPIQIINDEIPSKAKPEKIPFLKPVFSPDGTVTAANASSIADGAAAVMLMRHSTAKKYGLQPLAKIIGHSTVAKAPNWFTIAPSDAIKNLLTKINWSLSQVELFEINEAFAVVTLAAMRELGIKEDIVNINGGSCALGHPIGASGARIICTLLAALQRLDKKYGIASLCIGGGEATAIAIESMA